MGAQLNIKDAETIRKARELARERGQPVTAIIRSLVDAEWRAREQPDPRVLQAVDAIVAEVRRNMPAEWRGKTSKEIMDSIYDDDAPDGFAR